MRAPSDSVPLKREGFAAVRPFRPWSLKKGSGPRRFWPIGRGTEPRSFLHGLNTTNTKGRELTRPGRGPRPRSGPTGGLRVWVVAFLLSVLPFFFFF